MANNKTIIQCDFDGTISEEDVSFLILDEFAVRPWRPVLEQYQKGKISVGAFNTEAFSLVTADRETLLDFVRKKARIRPGFKDLVEFCHQKEIDFVIVSNGLDFYINFIIDCLGIPKVKVIAANSQFNSRGMNVKYIGPDGIQLLDKFKEAYTRQYIGQGYRVIYVGNGVSDFPSAKLAYRVFARQDLLDYCKSGNLSCIPFNDLFDVINELEKIIILSFG